jgi:hypothetical protein
MSEELLCANQPKTDLGLLILRFLDQTYAHTHTHTYIYIYIYIYILNRKTEPVISSSQRSLPTQRTITRDEICAFRGIRTRDPINRSAVEPHLRQHGLLDRHMKKFSYDNAGYQVQL